MQALWMLLASLLFATMGVCIKFASTHFNSFEVVFYRGLIGLVFMATLMRLSGVSVVTPVPAMHAWRSVVGTIALTTWFFSIAILPLATAMTLNYMSSVWIAAFLVGGALLLQKQGEPIHNQGPLLMSVLAGFAGVAMMLRPTMADDQLFGGLLGLLSGMFSALAYLQVSALSKAGEPETRTVFYFSLGATLVGAVGMLVMGASAWNGPHAWWLLPIGLLAVLGQLCMTRAYASGATLVVANLQYMGIVFAGIYSIVIFDDQLPLLGWLGMALIIASGIVATMLRARAAPQAPPEEH
ncbi:MAG TPA: DMT family transporter [Burkholderiaceae bacterium]|nr:DMT family transporter [Burkholderiaceae bacterium]